MITSIEEAMAIFIKEKQDFAIWLQNLPEKIEPWQADLLHHRYGIMIGMIKILDLIDVD
jgi:hypothetical protein